MLDYAAQGETGVTFYSVRGEILSALPWREIRERAQVTARRLIGAGFARRRAHSDYGRYLAGLLRCLLRRPVCRPAAGAGLDAGRHRRQGRLSRPAAPPARGLGRGGGRGHRRSRRASWPTRPLNSRPSACMAAWSVIEALPEKPVDLRPLGPADLCYIQFSSGSTRHPHGVQITQAALMANLAGMTGPGRPRRRAGRPRGELAAALSRHGPDRLPDGAALEPALDRLSDAARLRAPADAVAEPDLAQPRHHRLQPELRLRPRHAAAPPTSCRPISTCRAGATPASAAT